MKIYSRVPVLDYYYTSTTSTASTATAMATTASTAICITEPLKKKKFKTRIDKILNSNDIFI